MTHTNVVFVSSKWLSAKGNLPGLDRRLLATTPSRRIYHVPPRGLGERDTLYQKIIENHLGLVRLLRLISANLRTDPP